MQKPSFDRIPAARVDDFLFDLFVKRLGYARIDKDPDAPDPDAAEAWRMVVPVESSRPFAVAYQANLSKMRNPREVAKLYGDRVVPHRNQGGKARPVLYGFTDGARLVFYSADAARNRDDRFDLSEDTWAFEGFRERVERLRVGCEKVEGENGRVRFGQLEFQKRTGSLRPVVDFLFDASLLSSPDSRFKSYVRDVRRNLMKTVLADDQARGAVVYHLLEAPGARDGSGETLYVDRRGRKYVPKQSLGEPHVDLKARLGEAVAAAVDTLLLRYVMVRFLEAYHPDAMNGRLPSVEVPKRGKKRRKECVKTVLEEETKREAVLGGDFYPADLGRAAREVEEILLKKKGSAGSMLLRDLLVRTGDTANARRGFRYEDLKPKTLQDYYEESLSTAVRLTHNRATKQFDIDVVNGNQQRKELGAYYTSPHLCRFMVERTVKPLFDERLESLRRAVAAKSADEARRAFDAVMNFSVCDPTMGSAPFLRSAFDYLTESTVYFRLREYVKDAKEKVPALHREAARAYPFLTSHLGKTDTDGIFGWEWHVLRRMLYGVDIDLKAVRIACQTFALSSMRYVKQGERFPSFFNINLKVGNALISPSGPSGREELARKYGPELAKLIGLRRKAQTLQNTEEAYAELIELFREVDVIKRPIIDELIEGQVEPFLGEFTHELRPFAWELEFPEVFFSEDGSLKASAGFDVMIGNPPWEVIDVNDAEFFSALDSLYAGAKRDDRKRLKDRLLKDELIAAKYADARARCDAISKFVNDGRWYEFQKLQRTDNRRGFTPQNNYFRMAIELFYKASNPAAYVSVVAPRGIIGDEGVKNIRGLFFDTTRMDRVLAFKEKNDVFARPQAFAIVSARKGGSSDAVALVDGLTESSQLADLPPAVPVPVQTIKRSSPLSWTLIAARTESDLSVLTKLHAFPTLVDDVPRRWVVKIGTEEIHETRGAKLWSETPTYYVMRKGEFTEAFRVKTDVARYLKAKEFRKKAYPFFQSWRVAWRSVINEDSERRMMWAVVPPNSGIGNSLSWLTPGLSRGQATYFICLMNSLVVEYRARQLSTNNNMSHFIIKQLPFPHLSEGDALFDEIVRRGEALLGDFDEPPTTPVNGFITYPDMQTDEQKRALLRDEIDALVASAFKLDREDLRHILSSGYFRRIDERAKNRVIECFERLNVCRDGEVVVE